MERAVRALRIAGVLGVACGAVGYVGFFAGGDFGAFVGGALPGALLGLSRLVLLAISGESGK